MKKIFKHRIYGPVVISALSAALITLFVGVLDIAHRPDRWVEDALYQRPRALDGNIIVIGIDDRALEEIGPYNTWDRNVMASALEHLGSDPENRPAAVAIDTVYTGESDEEADRRLADAASDLGCVITASFATMGTRAVTNENGGMYFDHNAVLDYSLPYEQLKEATTQAHINAMTDEDGILRHAILTVRPDGEKVYSMAYTAAKKFADANGITITEPPVTADRYFVSFSALPGGYYDGYSICDLVSGRLDSELFAGKLVFIGPYAVGLQDMFFTAIDHGQQMYGVEYQANVAQMIIDGTYRKEVPDRFQAVILFVICAAAFFVFWNADFKISNIVAVALVAVSLAASYFIFEKGYVIHPLWIPAGVLVLYLASIAIRYVRSAIEKQQLTRTFERYVAPEIVSEILAAGPENLSLGGKLCDIAVLFVDVRGFTTMSERLAPEQVVHILNRYLTMASDCVENNKGTVDKFVGDAMMAFWGAPLECDDPVYKAVVTAGDIVKGAAEVSKELTEEIGEELNVGVGVHFGPAVVGNMGAERHMDYTAIGDTVNTSARLEANAPAGTIYISRAVADAVAGRIEYTSLGSSVKLKGKSEFEVLRLDKIL